MNVTPMVAAIALESREAVEMLLFENLPLETTVQIDQNQHVNCVHCVLFRRFASLLVGQTAVSITI